MHSEFDVIQSTLEKKDFSFHSLSAIITFILLPHFWCFSVPALIFSKESKKFYLRGNMELARYFSAKAAKFIVSSWGLTIFLAIVIALFALALTFSSI